MPSKRSKKVQKRQKALQRRQRQQHPTSKRHRLTEIPPERADQVAMTTTGELMQLVRLHYTVGDDKALRATFAKLRCMQYDARQVRWVWLYAGEAEALSFKAEPVSTDVVLGEFVFKSSSEVVLNLRSLDRAIQAIRFFDMHLPRPVAHLTDVTILNRLLSSAEAAAISSLDDYFDRADVVLQEPESLLQSLDDVATRIPDDRERSAAVMKVMDDQVKKQPVPAMERFPLAIDDEGIPSIETRFALHEVMAMRHWRGDTDFTRYDLMRDILRESLISTDATDTVSTMESPEAPPLAAQLARLIESESTTDWLHAWELIRDHLPENVNTFDDGDVQLGLSTVGLFINNFLYDLDMALVNGDVDEPSLTAIRAEVSRWVYTQFTEESERNQGNFRGHEAESLWDLGQRELAESHYQALVEAFPHFAWGYIWWGDCYWLSDWSYEQGPDYDRAEALYRQALANPGLEDRRDVQERLDELEAERADPAKRDAIQQARRQHRPRREPLEESAD